MMSAEELLAKVGQSGDETEFYTPMPAGDRKSTRLNSSHLVISYAVFCLKKKKAIQNQREPQLRDQHTHNATAVPGLLNPTSQAGLQREADQPAIHAERTQRAEIQARTDY